MKIGSMRHAITFQNQGTSRDTGGGISSGFSTLATVYANVKPTTGREVYKQGKVVGKTSQMQPESVLTTNYSILEE